MQQVRVQAFPTWTAEFGDRGHCMIAFDTGIELVEIGECYNSRSSYHDAADFDEMAEEDRDSMSEFKMWQGKCEGWDG